MASKEGADKKDKKERKGVKLCKVFNTWGTLNGKTDIGERSKKMVMEEGTWMKQKGKTLETAS